MSKNYKCIHGRAILKDWISHPTEAASSMTNGKMREVA